MNLTNSENTKNNTVLSETHNMELSMMFNAENITELNTVQNTILHNTSVEYENCTQYVLKKYKVMQELYRKKEKRRIVTQAVVQGALLIMLLLILIIMGIKNDYIR